MTGIADYELWKARQSQNNVGAARLVIDNSLGSPDEVASDINLGNSYAKQTGRPVPPSSMVRDNRTVFQKAIDREKNNAILTASPRLTSWLTNPDNAAVAKDDLENLSWFETSFKAAVGAVSRGIARVPQSFYQFQAQSAMQRAGDINKSATEILQEQSDGGFAGPDDLFFAGSRFLASRFADAFSGDQEAAAAYYQQQAGLTAQRIAEIPMSPQGERFREVTGSIQGNAGEQLQGFISAVADDPHGFLAFITEVAIESTPMLAVTAGVGIATRSPTAAAAVMGGMSGIQEAGSSPIEFFNEKGIDVSTPEGALAIISDPELMQEASDRGVARGVVIGLMDGLSGGMAGTALSKSPVGNVAIQSIIQAALGASGEAAAQRYAGQELNLTEIIIEGLAEFVTAPIEVAAVGGGQYINGVRQAKNAENMRTVFEVISGQSVTSKTRERLPDRFQNFLNEALKNGPIESVYVPASQFMEYFQDAGIDPGVIIDQLEGVTRDDLDIALENAQHLKIPTSVYAAVLAGTDHDAFFMDNMTFDPDGMTATEAREFNSRSGEAMQEAFDLAEKMRVGEEELNSVEDKVYLRVLSSLKAAGRAHDIAASEAMVWPAFYRTMAERSNISPEEFLQRYPVPVVRGALPEGMKFKNVDELNRMLAEARMLKPVVDRRLTLLEFIDGRGGINDVGGDVRIILNRRVVKRGRGRKNLTIIADGRGDHNGLDDMALAALESGFLDGYPGVQEYKNAERNGTEVPDITQALLDAIDDENHGRPNYSIEDPASDDVRRYNEIERFIEDLGSIGASLSDSDEDIRSAIERATSGGDMYDQSGLINTDSAAFKKWFGDSKVVDENGDPLVVYHGTIQDIESFSTSLRNSKMPNGMFAFTDSTKIAETYASVLGVPSREGKRLESLLVEERFDLQGRKALELKDLLAEEKKRLTVNGIMQTEGRNITPVYLSLKNPLIIDANGRAWTNIIPNEDFRKTQDINQVARAAKKQGYDGLVVRNVIDSGSPAFQGDEALATTYFAFAPTQIKSVNNRGTFDPDDPRILYQPKRGSIQFPQGGVTTGQTVISLFEGADLSTMLHETGHFFLTVMQDMAERGETGAFDDFNTIRKWWGDNAKDVAKDATKVFDGKITEQNVQDVLETGTSGDAKIDRAVGIGFQEQFAHGFETYLMEGRAPSIELRGAFERFRAWLLNVYRKVTGLDVAVNDEIRGVFDRMLASDKEIADAKADIGDLGPLFENAAEMGLTEEQYQKFLQLYTQAQEDGQEKLLREVMEPIRRENEKQYKADKEKVRDRVAEKVNKMPVYRAFEWMANRKWYAGEFPADMPEVRLDKKELVAAYGAGVLKTLPRGKWAIHTTEGGMGLEEAAGWFGFGSGDQMIKSLEQMIPRAEAITKETDRVMRATHGDVLNDGKVEEAALNAVHNDKRGQLISAELKSVIEVAGVGNKLSNKQARAAARDALSRMKVRDAINSNRFLAAERKTAQEAAKVSAMLVREKGWMDAARRNVEKTARKAARQDDPSVAGGINAKVEKASAATSKHNEIAARLTELKRQQLMNHALYMESRNVSDEVAKAERFVKRIGKKKFREKIAGAGRRENAQTDYLAAMDEILDRHDFRKISGKTEERRGALVEFIASMEAAKRGNQLNIPEKVIKDTARKPYKTMPVEELRGVIDALKNITYVATRWNELIDAKNTRDKNELVEGLVGSLEKNSPKRTPKFVNNPQEKLQSKTKKFFNLVLHTRTMLSEIDGLKALGPATMALKYNIDQAVNKLTLSREKAATDIETLYDVYSKDERRAMARPIFIEEIGESWTKFEIIALALNAGNEGNLSRLTDKNAFNSVTEVQLNAIIGGTKYLDARDAKFVQSIWDYIASFRPEIAARERRVSGSEPEWVSASPVTVGGVSLQGGYYPIKYDPRQSGATKNDEMNDIAKAMEAGKFAKAQTRRGHLEARAGAPGRAILLDISVFHNHINQVIYDLALSEPVANAWRVLQDTRVVEAFTKTGKQEDYLTLQTWLKNVGEGELKAMDGMGSLARAVRTNFTVSKLAFNFSTVAIQLTGLSQSMVVLGKKNFAYGVTEMWRKGVVDEIEAKSSFMRSRKTTFHKDMYDLLEEAKSNPAAGRWKDFKTEVIGPWGFLAMVKVQYHAVDVPTWLAAYKMGAEKFPDNDEKAVYFADDMVKAAQASGLFSDRSAMERGVAGDNRQTDLVRIFTTLASYMLAKGNVAYLRTLRVKGVVQKEGLSPAAMKEILNYTVDMTLLFTLEAVTYAAIKGRLPDEDDEDDTWSKFLVKETAYSVASTIPFVRDISGFIQGFEGGGAYGGIIADLGKPLQQAGQLEFDRALVKSMIGGAGIVAGVPSTQINRIIDGIWRQSEGEDVSPMEYLIGRSGK